MYLNILCKMACCPESEEEDHSQKDGARNNMSIEGSQIETALNYSAAHFDDANKSILQFCGDTGRKVNKTSFNLQVVKRDIHALKQQAEDSVTSLNVYRAQGESHDDRLGHLERRLAEVEQDNRVLAQQVENLKARQDINQSSLQELKEMVEDKLNHFV